MRFFPLGTIAWAMLMASVPAAACRGMEFERTVHPMTDAAPVGAMEGQVFKVKYEGERAGRQDRLWPNFYVVEIVEGTGAGSKALIPAHVTSCHSVYLPEGKEGYVVATLMPAEPEGSTEGMPILRIGLRGRIEKRRALM